MRDFSTCSTTWPVFAASASHRTYLIAPAYMLFLNSLPYLPINGKSDKEGLQLWSIWKRHDWTGLDGTRLGWLNNQTNIPNSHRTGPLHIPRQTGDMFSPMFADAGGGTRSFPFPFVSPLLFSSSSTAWSLHPVCLRWAAGAQVGRS